MRKEMREEIVVSGSALTTSQEGEKSKFGAKSNLSTNYPNRTLSLPFPAHCQMYVGRVSHKIHCRVGEEKIYFIFRGLR